MSEAFTFYVVDCAGAEELHDTFDRQKCQDIQLLGKQLLDELYVVENHTFDCEDDAIRYIELKSINNARNGLAWAVQYRVPMESKRLRAAMSKLNLMVQSLKQKELHRDILQIKINDQRHNVQSLKRLLGQRSHKTQWIIGGVPRAT